MSRALRTPLLTSLGLFVFWMALAKPFDVSYASIIWATLLQAAVLVGVEIYGMRLSASRPVNKERRDT